MPRINGDRQRHALLITNRLEGIAAARRKLVLQLEELDEQAKIMQRELNVLHNLDALTSNLPDEALAMIFEAGALPGSSHWPHFGVVVSHVSSRWRRVALSTSRLWTRIVWRAQNRYQLRANTSTLTFLERSRMSPLDITIIRFQLKDFSPDFLQLFNGLVGRCRSLCVKEGQCQWEDLMKAVECISNGAPLLSSIKLSASNHITLQAPLLPSGASRLKTADLHRIKFDSMHFILPAFISVTTLRLTGVWFQLLSQNEYTAFRNTLMALQSLHHLELQLDEYEYYETMDLPIVLPSVQYMRLVAPPGHLDLLTLSFRAASLVTLSLEGWVKYYHTDLESQSEMRFPLLEHLILTNIKTSWPYLDTYAMRFPGIRRLTCQVHPEARGCDLAYVLQPVHYKAQVRASRRSPSPFDGWERWFNLEVIAVSATDTPLDHALYDMVSTVKTALPLRKLLLPGVLCAQADADLMARLRALVQVEDYRLDWPTPFLE
ncbi:hypothetical protein HWV62_35172 [Athelia sp. TMB]|nr:hypothetical protein HWV62_35172 [Athelia sp. TMB]